LRHRPYPERSIIFIDDARPSRSRLPYRIIRKSGGDSRDAVKALIVANEFLEALVEELRADVSKGRA
jgi:hypothetical protein